MKALILNSGLGSRMGDLTREHPKCMTEIGCRESILSRQLRMLSERGLKDAVITTGYYDEVLIRYCRGLNLPLRYTFVKNPLYDQTNYIYSIYCAREELQDDLILMHGDLVFEDAVLDRVLASPGSCMTVSSTLPLPEKDFKAQVKDGFVLRVGIHFFEEAMAAQPLYFLRREDWLRWLDRIGEFCQRGETGVYAENALNTLEGAAGIAALDVKDLLCAEIDNPQDLETVTRRLEKLK